MKYIPFFLLVVLVLGCTGIKHYRNSNGRARPTNGNVFTYKKYADSVYDGSVVDTNAIYCWSRNDSGSKIQFNEYYRFFGHGRVFNKLDSSHIPNVNNYEDAVIGYYYIKGKELRMEIFQETYGIHGSLIKTFGYFSNDTLYLFTRTPATSYRAAAKGSAWPYKKIKPANLVPVTPDW